MKREMISHAIGNINVRHIEEAADFRVRRKTSGWIRMGAIAACAAFVVGLGIFGRGLIPDDIVSPIDAVDRPTAEDVGAIFAGQTDSSMGISEYIQFYYPMGKALDVKSIPSEAYLPLYRIESPAKELDSKELFALSDAVLSRLSMAFGVEMASWTTSEYASDNELSRYYRNAAEYENLSVRFVQKMGGSGADLCLNHTFVSNGLDPICLDGKQIQIDASQNEEEILASLTWVKEALFEAFGHSFDSEEVSFVYSGNRESGIATVFVRYFDADDLLGKQGITIRFNNTLGEDATILTHCDVTYTQYRLPVEQYITSSVGMVERISLERAEELLRRGYVFGSHSCTICMSKQDKISFEEYDTVDFEYVAGGDQMLPFYVFYKQIGTAENGNVTYAKTYVCAVEVDGMEEYFASREAEHTAGQTN